MSRPDHNNLEISGKGDEYSGNAECESLKKPIEENSRMAQEGNKSNMPTIHVHQQICVPFKKWGTCPYGDKCRHVYTIGKGRGKVKYRESSAITIVNGESTDVPSQGIGFEQGYLEDECREFTVIKIKTDGREGRYMTHSDIMEPKTSAECTKLKTRLCTLWERDNRCPYGAKCRFAHGKEELKSLDSSNPPELRSSADISAPAINVPVRNVPAKDVASNEIVIIAPADRRCKWNDIQRISRIYAAWIESPQPSP